MSMSEKAERKMSGKKRTRKDGEGTWNRKIKEEERRRRSADDDNGSGQGAVERTRRKEGKEENSIVRVWERDKGWKGGREEAT